MDSEPTRQCIPAYDARSDVEHKALLFVDRCIDLVAIEHQHYFHRCMANALVAVDERVIGYERKAQSGGFLDKRRVEVHTVERRTGLRESGFQQARSRMPVAPPDCSIGGDGVRRHPRGSEAASGQAAIQLGVLAKHLLGGPSEIVAAFGDEVTYGGTDQFRRRDAEPFGYLSQFLGLCGRQFERHVHMAHCRTVSVCSTRHIKQLVEWQEHSMSIESTADWRGLRQAAGLPA